MDVSLVVVGESINGGPFRITTEADLYSDEFELMGLTTKSGLKYLSYLPHCGWENCAARTAYISGSRTALFANR